MPESRRLYVLVCVITLFFLPLQGHSALAKAENPYVVQSGDTLIDIAVRYGVSPSELARARSVLASSESLVIVLKNRSRLASGAFGPFGLSSLMTTSTPVCGSAASKTVHCGAVLRTFFRSYSSTISRG